MTFRPDVSSQYQYGVESTRSTRLKSGLSTMPSTSADNSPAQMPYTAAELDERTKYRRAVEAVIWGMPLVNTEAMRQAYLRDVGAAYNDICYFSQPADWRFQVTTPNALTNYVYFNFNLKQGPVVIEVPEPVGAGLLGGMLDAWDVTIVGVGPQLGSNGKAAKYLLLPPGSMGDVPDGYIVVRFATFNGYALLRAIPVTKSEDDVAAALSSTSSPSSTTTVSRSPANAPTGCTFRPAFRPSSTGRSSRTTPRQTVSSATRRSLVSTHITKQCMRLSKNRSSKVAMPLNVLPWMSMNRC